MWPINFRDIYFGQSPVSWVKRSQELVLIVCKQRGCRTSLWYQLDACACSCMYVGPNVSNHMTLSSILNRSSSLTIAASRGSHRHGGGWGSTEEGSPYMAQRHTGKRLPYIWCFLFDSSPVWCSGFVVSKLCCKEGWRCWIMQTQWTKANIRSETKDTPLRSRGGGGGCNSSHYLREVILTEGLFKPICKLGAVLCCCVRWVMIKALREHLFIEEGCKA